MVACLAIDLPLAPPVAVAELVQRILGLHWAACLEGHALAEEPPPISVDMPAIRVLLRDPRQRRMSRPDRHSRFWVREFRQFQLLLCIALHSGWLNGATRPVSTASLAQQSGLSDRMVRLHLQRAIATGDLLAQPGHRRDGHRLELSPAVVACLEQRDREHAESFAVALGHPVPALKEGAARAFHRLVATMQLCAAGPLGTPMTDEVHRRCFRTLLLDLLLDGPQPLAELVARQAERTRVTPMTIRNTARRAAELGWLSLGETVRVTELGRQLQERAYAALVQRWRLVLALMAMLEDRPGLAGAVEYELQAIAAAAFRPADHP
jgi:hypothetical protein